MKTDAGIIKVLLSSWRKKTRTMKRMTTKLWWPTPTLRSEMMMLNGTNTCFSTKEGTFKEERWKILRINVDVATESLDRDINAALPEGPGRHPGRLDNVPTLQEALPPLGTRLGWDTGSFVGPFQRTDKERPEKNGYYWVAGKAKATNIFRLKCKTAPLRTRLQRDSCQKK